MLKIKAEKDFIAGLFYIVIASIFLWIGRDYKLGVASRMGPGYFPLVLGWILFGFGIISVIRSFFKEGAAFGSIAWKPLGLLTLALIAFALLITPAGLIIALPILVILSAFASKKSVYNINSLLILIGLTLFCIIVFVKALGVPLPIFGTWFNGIIPTTWQ